MSKSTNGKPLKGGQISSSQGVFGTVRVDNIIVGGQSLTDLSDGAQLINASITKSQIDDTPIGLNGEADGYFSRLRVFRELTLAGLSGTPSIKWDPGLGRLTLDEAQLVLGAGSTSQFGNIAISKNTIQAVNPDGDVNLAASGTGLIRLQSSVNATSAEGSFSVYMPGGDVTQIGQNVTLGALTGSVRLQGDTVTTGASGLSIETMTLDALRTSGAPDLNRTETHVTVIGVTARAFAGTLGAGRLHGQQKVVSISQIGVDCLYTLSVNLAGVDIVCQFEHVGQNINLTWNADMNTWIARSVNCHVAHKTAAIS